MNALIFHARSYSFQGKDGKQVVGNNVSYMEDMDPFNEPLEKGLAPMSMRAGDEALAVVLREKLPAIFDIELGRRPSRDSKPETYLKAAKLLRPVSVDALLGLGK